MSPGGQPVDRLAVEHRVGPGLAELPRTAELEREVARADRGDAQVGRVLVDELADGPAQLPEALRARQGRREDVRVDRDDGQVGVGPGRDDRADDRVVELQLVADGEVESAVEQTLKHEP